MIGPSGTMPYINNLILWNASPHPWGMSYAGSYPAAPSAHVVKSVVNKLHSYGVKALPYMSSWFHGGRNASEYVSRVAEWKTEFNIDGM
jgi:hypothetical protein